MILASSECLNGSTTPGERAENKPREIAIPLLVLRALSLTTGQRSEMGAIAVPPKVGALPSCWPLTLTDYQVPGAAAPCLLPGTYPLILPSLNVLGAYVTSILRRHGIG